MDNNNHNKDLLNGYRRHNMVLTDSLSLVREEKRALQAEIKVLQTKLLNSGEEISYLTIKLRKKSSWW